MLVYRVTNDKPKNIPHKNNSFLFLLKKLKSVTANIKNMMLIFSDAGLACI